MCVDSVEKERIDGEGQRKAENENDLITYIEYILKVKKRPSKTENGYFLMSKPFNFFNFKCLQTTFQKDQSERFLCL